MFPKDGKDLGRRGWPGFLPCVRNELLLAARRSPHEEYSTSYMGFNLDIFRTSVTVVRPKTEL